MSKKPIHQDPLRTAAEARLACGHAPKQKPRPDEKLLHEFRVHQVELEMQNEQLRQSQIELVKSHDRYVDFYDFAPVGYLTLNREGMIDEINPTCAALLKVERNKLPYHRFASYVAMEDRDRWHRHFMSVLKDDKSLPCELALQHDNEPLFYARLDCLRLKKDSEEPAVRVVLTDITRSKQSEDELQRFFNFAPDLVCIASTDGHFQKINSAWQETLGYTEQEILAKPFLDLIHPDDRGATMKEVERQLAGEATLQFTNRYRCKDGSYKWLEWKATPAVDKKLLFASARDITERKLNEAKIQRLTQLYAALSQCNQAIVRCTGADELFQQACRIAVQYGDFKMAWVALVDPVTQRVSPADSFGNGADEYLQDIEISADADSPFGRGPTGTAIRENRPVWCQDFPNDPSTAPWHERGARFGWGSSTALPLHRNGIVIGAFSIFSNETNAFDEAARDLLLEMASDISYALNNFAREAERKAAESQLMEHELQYRTLADSSPALIWTSGTDMLCDYFNKVWLKFTGRTLEQELGNGWAEGVHPDDLAQCMDIYVAAFDRREPFGMTYRLRRHDGAYRWIQDDGCPRYNTEGEFIGYIGYCLDITERKQSEAALKESEERFALFMNYLPAAAYIKDSHGKHVFVNEMLVRQTGSILGKTNTEIWPKEIADKLDAVDAEVMANERPHVIEEYILSGNEKRTFNTSKFVFRNVYGEKFLAGISFDITERKQAEEAMARYARDMGERVKEISCLRDITLLSKNNELGLDRILDGCVRRMPAGWLDPSRTCARIRFNDRTFETPNFHETAWKLAAEIPFATENSGAVEVFYMGDESEEIKNPFLDEEHDLIKSIALHLALALESRWAEEKLYQLNRDFVLFLENTTDFIYFKDENSRFRFCSQTLASITGHTSWRDMVGKHDLEVFPKDTAQIYYEEELPIFREGKPLLNKIDPYYDAQGAEGWVSTNKWPVLDDEGKKVVGIFGISRNITAYQKTVIALTRSEQHFRAFFERSMVGMTETSPEKGWVEVNDRLCEMLGYSREELVHMTWAELTHPDDLAADVAQFNRVLAGDINEYTMDKRFIHRDGHVVYTYLALRCVRREDGAVNYFVAMVEDITERKLANIALLASEQNLIEAQQQAHIGSWELNPVSNQHVWSEEMYRIFGISPEQLGTNYSAFLDTLHPDDRDMVSRAYAASLSDGPPYDVEYRFIRKSDGQLRWGHARCEHERDANGKVLRSFGTVQDITERKQAEVTLQESEFRWKFAIEGSGDGLWDWNVAESTVFFTKRWKEMLGFTEDEIGNGLDEWEKRIHPDDKAEVFSTMQAYCDGKTPSYINEHRVLCKDGSYKWILDRGIVVSRSEDGKPLRMIGTHTDITERKQAEEVIRSASQHTRSLIEVSLDPLVTISAEGKITDVNTATENVTGVNRRGLIGSDFVNYFTDPEKAREGYQLVFLQGFVIDYPLAIRHVSGKITDVLYNASVYRDSNGKVLGVFAAARDVTERKHAELKAAALIHRNHVLMQSTSEGIHILDDQGNIIEANEAFCRHLGYTMEEVLQLSIFDFDAKLTSDELRANLKEMQNSQVIFETVHRRKDGTLVDVEINISGVDLEGQKCLFALSRDITRKKETEQIIWKQANFDTLTGLPNRHMFHERVAQEIKKSTRSGTPFALMFIDLDHFKEVNDTLGHDMGDVLLIETTRRITDCVRATDIVARMGGDEFTILLTEVDDLGSVERIAQNIIQQLAASFQLKKEMAYVSASIGITLYPNDATDIEGLLKNADQAMYVAKEQGRNRHSYFTPALHETAQTKLRLVNDLRGALAANQFIIYFQPIVELATGNIHKAEALIRWQHPERGLVSPAQFIPLAEETGLILGIGDWVFYESMRHAKRWRELYNPKFQISVNKSPIQFYKDGEEHTAWLAYLKEIDLPGQALTVEITEGLLLDSNASINGALFTLRNAAIQVSIDDFGTGYSSLAYLKKFDIDYLKIDQSFVRHLEIGHNDLTLCEAIIVMAHKLGIKVIAEGVETVGQRDLLAAAGCDYAQGYLYSKPVPAEEFEELLK